MALDLYSGGLNSAVQSAMLIDGLQEGILTVVVSVAAYFFIHNYPNTARFLSDNERAYIHERLKHDNDATRQEGFTWPNVAHAVKDPKVWLYGLGFHTLSLPLYTLSLFLPSMFSISHSNGGRLPSLTARIAQHAFSG